MAKLEKFSPEWAEAKRLARQKLDGLVVEEKEVEKPAPKKKAVKKAAPKKAKK